MGVTCCREMMPDPSRYAELLLESFSELEQAAATDKKQVQKKKSKTSKQN